MLINKLTSIITIVLPSWILNINIFFLLEVSLSLERFAVLEKKNVLGYKELFNILTYTVTVRVLFTLYHWTIVAFL